MAEYWQCEQHTLIERMRELFKRNSDFKDVSFDVKVGFGTFEMPFVFHANKAILAIASPVFEKMLYGSLAEKTDDQPITITGIGPHVFSQILEYIYTDEINLQTIGNAIKIYEAADKYMLTQLEKKCVEYLKGELKPATALEIYEFAKFYNQFQLEIKAMKIIREQTIAVISSDSFADVKFGRFNELLDENQLQTTEIQLFEALESLALSNGVIKSSGLEADVNNNSDEKEELSKTYRAALKKIHFNLMTTEQFLSGPALSELMLPTEAIAISACLNKPSLMKVLYPSDFAQNVRQAKQLRHVFFDINAGGLLIGRIIIQLRSDVIPVVIKEFITFCDTKNLDGFKDRKLTFDESKMCKVETKKNWWKYVFGGHVLKNTGLGSFGLLHSITDATKIFHDSFLISFDDSDLPYLFIGQVVKGIDVVEALKSLPTEIMKEFCIENCGEITFSSELK